MPFQLSSIRPDNGLAKGGTLVAIAGSGFTQARASMYCYFGNSSVAATVDSDHKLACTSPPFQGGSYGEVDISVVHGSDVFVLEPQHFTYSEDLVLHDKETQVLLSEREYYISIHGSSFMKTRELACMLDHINLILEATYVNNTEIMCNFPQVHYIVPPNSYKLSVSNNGPDYLDSSMPVRVVDPFKIHFIEPPMGSPDVIITRLWV
jgi:hypothetical protein